MTGIHIPSKCDTVPPTDACKNNPYVVIADDCEYIDQQTLKLQECPEAVPTGEMPRNIMLSGMIVVAVVVAVVAVVVVVVAAVVAAAAVVVHNSHPFLFLFLLT